MKYLAAIILLGVTAQTLAAPKASVDSLAGFNPLWAIPLTELTVTRERPIFSPSRRSAAATPYVPPESAKPREADRPQLSLVGTIAGDTGGFGIFLDRTSNIVLTLKTGAEHKGWILRAVRGRDAVLEKDERAITFSLPLPSDPAADSQDEDDGPRPGR
jgi:hypothetical protein